MASQVRSHIFPVLLLSLLSLSITPVAAEGKTSIFIDQIPLYSRLAPCAEDRVSAIIRAQFSGCGDDRQLTSFSCFCIDSSTEFNSIISTAVQEQCALSNTRSGLASITNGAPAPEVTDALQLFNSYCSKSTMLSRFDITSSSPVSTEPAPRTVTVPSIPSATAPTSSESNETPRKRTNIAAIVVPVIVVSVAIIAAVVFFLYRRRRNTSNSRHVELEAHEAHATSGGGYAADRKTPPPPPPKELIGENLKRQELGNGAEVYAHEMQVPGTPRVELDAGYTGEPQEKKPLSKI